MTVAPVALFAYQRPDHLTRTLRALSANAEAARTELYIFSDGAKTGDHQPLVDEVRRIARAVTGFRDVHLVCRERNFGLAGNIVGGVTQVLARHESIVVLEDDIVVGPFFLRFMNDALARYRDETRVGSITGYCYPLDAPVPDTFFIRGADCWSWATWRDRWAAYNPSGQELLDGVRASGRERDFDYDGAMPYTRMLEEQIAGHNDSWAVRWHASCFLEDLLILYPRRPLAQNIGRDGTGTHSQHSDDTHDVELWREPMPIGEIAIEESAAGRAAFQAFFSKGQSAPEVSGRRADGARWRGWIGRLFGRQGR